MANSVPFIRLYLKEQLRKHLGINLKNKKIYVFKVHNKTYLSTDMIPKTGIYATLQVKLGYNRWYINIPTTHLDYTPTSYRLLNTLGKVIELTKGD
jgi:hypothetical protein